MTTPNTPQHSNPSFFDHIINNRSVLRTVLENSSDPLFLLDAKGQIQMLNRAAINYCRIKAKDALGRSCADILRHGRKDGLASAVTDGIRTGKLITWKNKTTASPLRWEEISILPLTPIEDADPSVIIHIRNIIGEKKINELLEKADRLTNLDRLAGGIFHQIRNPLSAITLFTDILADKKRFSRTEQELEILADIKDNVRTLTDIITRVQGFTGQTVYPALSVDINAVISDILQLWAPALKRTAIRVDFSHEPDLPAVTGHPVEVGQAVSNLIHNAIEAMNDGGLLTLTTSLVDSSLSGRQQMVLITCIDTGHGIDEGLQESIFVPFYSTKQTNSGMGLTVASCIVQRFGGKLSCLSSVPGKTIFTMELPLAPQTENDEINS